VELYHYSPLRLNDVSRDKFTCAFFYEIRAPQELGVTHTRLVYEEKEPQINKEIYKFYI